nr:beta-ketoacyl synthase N-terminal-like domain-containing protein [Nocardia bovistercoris]
MAGDLAAACARRVGLGGEAITVASASAAGAAAIGIARDLIATGAAPSVIAGGADAVTDMAFLGLNALRTLGPEGCRPFSSRRRGIGLSEGAAVLRLERHAGRSPEAGGGESPEVNGGGLPEAAGGGLPQVNGDGRPRVIGGESPVSAAGGPPVSTGGESQAVVLAGCGLTNATTHLAAPGADGIELAVRLALADAGLGPEDVDFVNAHGPGTRRGDDAEIAALRAVFGARLSSVPVNSLKGVLWHLQGGAGAVEALACALSLIHGAVTPTWGSDPVDPAYADLDLVGGTVPRPVPGLRTALTISCGLGGMNTALVLRRPS